MQHSFNVEFAVKYGVTEAILISNLEYWIKKNKANNKNFFDGRYWTYNSIKAWSELFPYLSEKKIRNALKNLENEGLILTGNYNTSAYDRTRWYAFSDIGISILLKRQMEDEKKENQNCQNGEPIPNIIPDTIPDSKTDSSTGKKKKEQMKTHIPSQQETGFSDEMQEAFEDWLNYKKERREPYKDTGLKTLLKKLKSNIEQYGEEAVIDMLTKTIAAGYQGPVWDWLTKSKPAEKPKKDYGWDGFYYEGMFDEAK